MSTNLVSLVSNVLTPELVAKVAAALGIDPALVQKAVSAAIPALLGSFAKAASTPDGARRLFDTATTQSPDLLTGLAGMIGGTGQQTLVETGNRALSGLLGPGASASLGDAISKFAGVSPGQGTSLIGMLAPVALGALGQQARSSGLDASGLGKMLSAEAPSILGALPPGLSNALSAGGLLGGLQSAAGSAGDAVRSAGATAQATASAAASSAARAAAAPAKTGGLPSWAGWVAGLIVLILAGWWLFGSSQKTEEAAKTAADTATEAAKTATTAAETATNAATDAAKTAAETATNAAETATNAATDAAKTAAETATNAAQTATEAASGAMEQVVASIPELTVGGVDVAATANQAIGGLKDALGQIKDADSAKAALPKIDDASAKLGQIEGLVAQMPAAGKTALATALTAARPSIDALFDKVLTMPGVAEVAKPAIDGIRAKLDAITKPA